MSYQVGSYCYASVQDAGIATCSQYSPVSSITSAGAILQTSCEGVNAETGALQIKVATSLSDGSATTYRTVEQLPAYAECQQGEYVAAFSSVGMTAFVIIGIPILTYLTIKRFLFNYGKRDES